MKNTGKIYFSDSLVRVRLAVAGCGFEALEGTVQPFLVR
jgi:hypothetical protein